MEEEEEAAAPADLWGPLRLVFLPPFHQSGTHRVLNPLTSALKQRTATARLDLRELRPLAGGGGGGGGIDRKVDRRPMQSACGMRCWKPAEAAAAPSTCPLGRKKNATERRYEPDAGESAAAAALKSQPGWFGVSASEAEMDAFRSKWGAKRKMAAFIPDRDAGDR